MSQYCILAIINPYQELDRYYTEHAAVFLCKAGLAEL